MMHREGGHHSEVGFKFYTWILSWSAIISLFLNSSLVFVLNSILFPFSLLLVLLPLLQCGHLSRFKTFMYDI